MRTIVKVLLLAYAITSIAVMMVSAWEKATSFKPGMAYPKWIKGISWLCAIGIAVTVISAIVEIVT